MVPLEGLQDGTEDDTSSSGGLGGTSNNESGGATASGGTADPVARPRVEATPQPCALRPSNPSTTVHVDVGGDDGAPGTASEPLATIARAVELSTPGCMISLGEGLFEASQTIVLPEGVSLVGAGSGKTTLRGAAGGTLISIQDAHNTWISGMDLDGAGRSSTRAISVVGADGLTVADIDAHNFSETTLRIERGTAPPANVTVCQSTFSACGSTNGALSPFADLGCVHVDPPQNSLFSDITIDTDLGSGLRIDSALNEPLINVIVEFIDIKVPSLRDTGGAPQYALTMRNVTFDGVIIRQSRMNGMLGVWQAGDAPQDLRIHDNTLATQNVALELDVSGAEIDHNYIESRYYWLLNLNSSAPRTGFNVHHNVIGKAGKPNPLGHFSPVVDGLNFVSNTIILSGNLSGTDLFLFGGGGNAHVFANNIFYSSATSNADNWGLLEGTTVKNNLFYGLDAAPLATDSITEDPGFDIEGTTVDEQFRLPDDSPARMSGVDLTSANPMDLGACTREEAPCVGAEWVERR